MIDKVILLQQKMSFDTTNRMGSTLSVLRACRVLNYQFVSDTSLNALKDEIEQLQRIPSCILMIERRVRKLLRSFSKRDIKTNAGTN